MMRAQTYDGTGPLSRPQAQDRGCLAAVDKGEHQRGDQDKQPQKPTDEERGPPPRLVIRLGYSEEVNERLRDDFQKPHLMHPQISDVKRV